jgi:electron transfer flavoprotein alpha subunit
MAVECISAAKSLGESVRIIAVALGSKASELERLLSESGADEVYTNKDYRLDDPDPEIVASLLGGLLQETKSEGLLFGSSRRGKEIAARTATRLRVGCATDVIDIASREGSTLVKRQVYGGKGVATLRFKTNPFVVTVAKGYFDPPERAVGRVSIVKELHLLGLLSRKKIVNQPHDRTPAVDISRAEVVIAVGRGFRKKEDIRMAEELANLMGGVLACSRPISADYAWLPEDRQVGLSGRVVKPRLYVALGISGQIQHLVGMRSSRTILSVNTDANAPIVESSDYFVQADIYEFLPALIKAIKSK